MADIIEITGYVEYVTAENDTFDLIAYRQYGNEFLASLIIQENSRYADTIIFDSGVKLKLPIINIREVENSLPPWRQGAADDGN